MTLMTDTFNYMTMASNIVSSKYFADNEGKKSQLNVIEQADLRMAEIKEIAKSPAHRILAVMLERDINRDIIFHLSDKEGYVRLYHLLKTYNPLHCPIASSLTQDQINEFHHVRPDSPQSKEWNKNQAWFFGQQYPDKMYQYLHESKGVVTLKTGLESVDYSITQYSYAIARFFYTLQVLPEAIPAPMALMIQHAMGIEQVRKSPTYNSIRKALITEMESGDLPVQINLDQCFADNLEAMMTWLKPRDVVFANAYAFGKRDIEWLEQYAPADVVLERLTQGFDAKQLHHKWASSFSRVVLDLCDHLKKTDAELASKAFYGLVSGISTAKILSAKTSEDILARIYSMAEHFSPVDAGPKGILTLKVIEHRDSRLATEVLADYISSNKLAKQAIDVMEGVYPDVVVRSRVLHSLGIQSKTKALVKEKGKALMDELGL
jgi:hypothetical protein